MKLRDTFPRSVDDATLAAGWRGIGARRRRIRTIRRVLVAGPVVAIALVLVFFALRRPHRAGIANAPAPHVLALAGGAPLPASWTGAATSRVALDDGSRLELAEDAELRPLGTIHDPKRVGLALEAGEVTFDVRPGGPRLWTVDAGDVHVRVLGTRFTVIRDHDRVRVSVARGKVRVESGRLPGGRRDLTAGERIDVGAPEEPAPIPATPVSAVREAPKAPPSALPARSALPERPGPARDPMADADAARREGRPRDAITILGAVVDRKEPSAPLAAFTIGKIYSEELGDQASGATWFERAITLGLPSALDEDAHARVVECLGRAGRGAEATKAAARYETKYPTGRHLARVRRWTEK